MKWKYGILAAILTMALGMAVAGTKDDKDKDKDAPTAAASHAAVQDDPMRLEGEQKFHSNCGRCHAAPPKFAPRMAATIVRHMRVRATLTDEEMRAILRYLSR